MALGKAKTRLPSENVARKSEDAFSEQKRDNRVKAWVGKAKTLLSNENVAFKGENASAERNRHSQRRKFAYRDKTSHF